MVLRRQSWCLSSVNWLFSMLCHMIHLVYASILTPGHVSPEVIGASGRASISMRASSQPPSHSCSLQYVSYDEDPAFSARAAFACARFLFSPCLPFCHPASISLRPPRMPDTSRCCRFNSPPTLRIAAPCLPGARRRVACRPSGFGARRGRRRRGSGCSCAIGRNAPSVSESGAGNRRVQIW